jgi:hypothetical protein
MGDNNFGLRFIQKEAPNGWIVVVAIDHGTQLQVAGAVFVPDPTHEWRADRTEERSMKAPVLQ